MSETCDLRVNSSQFTFIFAKDTEDSVKLEISLCQLLQKGSTNKTNITIYKKKEMRDTRGPVTVDLLLVFQSQAEGLINSPRSLWERTERGRVCQNEHSDEHFSHMMRMMMRKTQLFNINATEHSSCNAVDVGDARTFVTPVSPCSHPRRPLLPPELHLPPPSSPEVSRRLSLRESRSRRPMSTSL